ncbi:Cell surface Cu-only superoxide dismutase 5 [Cyphellophora attinorum]|uniref:Cell surface Cu-only superoxide dismutase 5 n=1 Tax=Cyphellophora attinorum TaxID=1664694 RepID=A0A0N0NQC2_9EURO|nr:Cell surface Cu-only superoxide dismutase 5 [Phialophora attinorum]KPI43738.1 Cell surface Cu-only superoxide dismutase 5 [Phialophora attinorum]
MSNSLTMLLVAISALIFSAFTAAQVAPLATNQPVGTTYQAILNSSKPIQGSITGVASDNGTGVNFNIILSDFPDYAIYVYHIHVDPVVNGNCSSAGGHLRPFGGPEDTVKCDPSHPELCQVGDLSGKHGNITQEALTNGKFMIMYNDLYVNAIQGNEAFFGSRSIVVHAANLTRLNCANFVLQGASNGTGTSTATTSAGTSMVTSSATETGTGVTSQTGTTSSSSTRTGPSPSAITSSGGDGGVPALRDNSWVGVALMGVLGVMFAA